MRLREQKKKRFCLIALFLSLTLLCGGCQSAAVQEVQSQKTEASSLEEENTQADETKEIDKTEETEETSNTQKEEEAPVYIDADYVDANYEDEDTDDLSKYKTDEEDAETSGDAKSSDKVVTGTKDSDDSSSAEEDEDWEGWDAWAEGQDEYLTDPIPAGKPEPVEPQDEIIDTSTALSCTLYVECSTILDNLGDLTEGKEDLVPSDGVIYGPYTVTFYQGESVYDLLLREMQDNRIHMESEFTPIYNSAYVQGINNLYEKDCGSLSGWMYCVDGWYPNYGCSRYQLQDGAIVEWHYTCDLGRDLGRDVSQE